MTKEETFELIRELTDINAHIEAYIVGCRFLGERLAAERLQGLLYANPNGFSGEDYKKKDQYYARMMAVAKERFTAEQFETFRMCF